MFAHSLRTNISSYRTVALRLSPELYLVSTECQKGRSQWPSGRGSEAARLLRLRVRIPPGTWMSVVSIVCSQVEVSATDRYSSREVLPIVHWRQNRHNTSGQTPDEEVEINHVTAYVGSYKDPTVWPKQVGLFRADSLARHLLQFS